MTMPTNQGLAYTTAYIPKIASSEQLEALAIKFRAFKLHSLKVAPEAFSAELHVESELPRSTWLARITEPRATILICVATPKSKACRTSEDTNGQLKLLFDGEWVGMFTMIGPVSRDEYIWPDSGQPEPGPEDAETRWQLTSLFTLPAYRGCGIAKRLTEAAVGFGKLASAETERVTGKEVRTRIRLVVHPKNTGVVKMYEKFGFVDSARMTVAEACVANGAGDVVPKNADPEKWHSRFAVAMEVLV
jgi:ribosomal protein S18 acetylase RimI-like enzyme